MEESFLRRWSRKKRELPAAPAAPSAEPVVGATVGSTAPPAALPEVGSLEMASDFLPFMQDEVAEDLRRAALQKLFAAEHFNVMDGLDVYIDDYNKFEPIGEEMLQQLMQAPGLLNDIVPESAASAEPEADAKKDDAADGMNDEADKPG